MIAISKDDRRQPISSSLRPDLNLNVLFTLAQVTRFMFSLFPLCLPLLFSCSLPLRTLEPVDRRAGRNMWRLSVSGF